MQQKKQQQKKIGIIQIFIKETLYKNTNLEIFYDKISEKI